MDRKDIDLLIAETFEFVDKVDEFRCVFCKLLYKKQSRLSCNHLTCRTCKSDRLKKCPTCNYYVECKNAIVYLEAKIMKLRVRCQNKQCDFTETLKNFMEFHKMCEFSTVCAPSSTSDKIFLQDKCLEREKMEINSADLKKSERPSETEINFESSLNLEKISQFENSKLDEKLKLTNYQINFNSGKNDSKLKNSSSNFDSKIHLNECKNEELFNTKEDNVKVIEEKFTSLIENIKDRLNEQSDSMDEKRLNSKQELVKNEVKISGKRLHCEEECNSQKIEEISLNLREGNDVNFNAKELMKIIEKQNEKITKLEVSYDLILKRSNERTSHYNEMEMQMKANSKDIFKCEERLKKQERSVSAMAEMVSNNVEGIEEVATNFNQMLGLKQSLETAISNQSIPVQSEIVAKVNANSEKINEIVEEVSAIKHRMQLIVEELSKSIENLKENILEVKEEYNEKAKTKTTPSKQNGCQSVENLVQQFNHAKI